MLSASWKKNLLQSPEEIRALLRAARRVAVLGIKTEGQSEQAAFYVPKALADDGLEIIPVPVYFPQVTHILGKPVYRRVQDIPGSIDIVDVFRRSEHISAHVDDLLAARPRAVWFQMGIRNDAVAEQLARAGIQVVQNRCLMVDYHRFCR